MKRSNLFLYILLNIAISAATTLGVLWYWDKTRTPDVPSPAPTIASAAVENLSVDEPTEHPGTPEPTETLPPVDTPVIQILSIVGAGDLQTEAVLLKRVGQGNLRMAGWRLEGEDGDAFAFPEQPELVLYQDGAVQVFTRAGENTATEVYWNQDEPAWQSGESIRLLDREGNERATYRVP